MSFLLYRAQVELYLWMILRTSGARRSGYFDVRVCFPFRAFGAGSGIRIADFTGTWLCLPGLLGDVPLRFCGESDGEECHATALWLWSADTLPSILRGKSVKVGKRIGAIPAGVSDPGLLGEIVSVDVLPWRGGLGFRNTFLRGHVSRLRDVFESLVVCDMRISDAACQSSGI